MFNWIKSKKKPEFDIASANRRCIELVDRGYYASALNIADEAMIKCISSPDQAFWLGRKASLYAQCGDYKNLSISLQRAIDLARIQDDQLSIDTRIFLLDYQLILPYSYETLEKDIKEMQDLNPANEQLDLARVMLSGRDKGQPFYEMLKMIIAHNYDEKMSIQQKSTIAAQWGLMIHKKDYLELPQEYYREAVMEYVNLLYEITYANRMQLITQGEHDPEEYLMILRPAVLAIHGYMIEYPWDQEMEEQKYHIFFSYAHFGDPRSTRETEIKFELLIEALPTCSSCGLPLVRDAKLCWNCGASL